MTGELVHLWIGLTVVGLGLTVKVIRDGLFDVDVVLRQREKLRKGTLDLFAALDKESEETRQLAVEVEALQAELQELEQEGQHLRRNIGNLKKQLGRTRRPKFRVDRGM